MTVADSITNALLRFGRPMQLRRRYWNGINLSYQTVTIYGVAEGPPSVELADGMASTGHVRVTFSNAQIAAAGWPGPPEKLDEIILDDGEARPITAVETKYLGTQVLVFVADAQALNYDRTIRIERATVTTDDHGGEALSWAELDTVLASKVDVSGKEDEIAAQLNALVVTRFQVRWKPSLVDLSPKDRIVAPDDNNRIYDIEAVKELQLRVGWEIIATSQR